jgi:hypothetical protein
VRGGSLAPRLRSAARVRGDCGRFCSHRLKKNGKTLITRTPAISRPRTRARNGRETAPRANAAGPRHGGGTTGRASVRGGSLAPRLRSAARVRGDRGRFCARRPKKNRKTLITRTPATSRPGTCARNGRETALMANAAGPRHGGGTTGCVLVRGGSLAPRLRSAARVRGDRGRFCAHRPKRIGKR